MFIHRKLPANHQRPVELPPNAAATTTAPANVPVRSLSRLEKSRIDNAVKTALKQLPKRLVNEMATIPPANKEVAELYRTTVPQLQGERRTAVHMIALHAVMEKLIETRNKHWCRADREHMSAQIDTYARESILREINCLCDAQKSTEVRRMQLPQYVVGVSQKENNLLIQMTAAFMDQCIENIPESDRAAAETIDLSKRPFDEHKRVYANFDREMGQAFSSLFKEHDGRVCARDKNGALVGVDQRKLMVLAGALTANQKKQPGNSEPRQWLATQQDKILAAMDRAASDLPAETRNAWKAAYASQFLKGHDLETFAESGAALWDMREQRKVQAQKTPAAVLPQTQLQQWMTQAIEGIKTIVEEADGMLAPRSATPPNPIHALPDTGEEKTQEGDEIQPAPKYESGSKRRGTFSDLRIAYEDNRSGVPWKDTRAQESIEKIAKPMMKRLLPEHRAGVLQALSAYGKNATHFFAKHKVQIESMRKDKFIKERKKSPAHPAHIRLNEKREEGSQFTSNDKQYETVYRFQQWEHDVSHVCTQQSSLHTLSNEFFFGNFVCPIMRISPGDTHSVESTAFHELGHITDFSVAANMGLGRYKPNSLPIPYPISIPLLISNFKSKAYSDFPLIKNEHVGADNAKSGLTRYAETNEREFFAEAATAYFGSPPKGYETNVMTPGVAVYSAENLKMQHPHTFAALDELVRAKLDVPQAKRSLTEKNAIADDLMRLKKR